MEEKKLERKLMSEEEYKEYIENKINDDFNNGIIHLHTFEGVSKFKSVRRAIKRGHVSPYGMIYPKRPFNNRAGYRENNDYKKRIYEQLKYK